MTDLTYLDRQPAVIDLPELKKLVSARMAADLVLELIRLDLPAELFKEKVVEYFERVD